MSDLRDLYQEVILDHSRRPRNVRKPDGSNRHADGYNPLCGDKISVYLRVANGVVEDAGFLGSGCAISSASASMMTDCLAGKTEAEALLLFERFHDLVTGRRPSDELAPLVGKLAVFSGVREFPIRVKCATLAWHTFKAALDNVSQPVSTE